MTRGFPRSDRALELREQGFSYSEIALRMNTNKNNVSALLSQAKKRRDQERLKAAAIADVMGANV